MPIKRFGDNDPSSDLSGDKRIPLQNMGNNEDEYTTPDAIDAYLGGGSEKISDKVNANESKITSLESNFKVFLPDEIFVAVGRTIEIYNSQISWGNDVGSYSFRWSGIGKSLKRKWSLEGSSSNVGNYALQLDVFDQNNNLQGTYNSTVRVAGDVIASPLSVLPIGDSLTNRKFWLTEVNNLSSGQITFTGTRTLSGNETGPLGHEGRSGAASAYYLGNNSYTFDSNGIDGIDGRSQDLNPFWNPNTLDVDYSYYLSNYTNTAPDVIQIWLGTNGIEVDPTTNAGNIKTFIDKLRSTGANGIPVYVVYTLFRPDQNGIGEQGAVDGYNPSMTDYKLEEDLKVINLAQELRSILDGYADLKFVPVAQCHDSEYNFGQVPTPVNPRSSVTVNCPVESIHPQIDGYRQIADVVFSAYAADYGTSVDLDSMIGTFRTTSNNETLVLPFDTSTGGVFVDWGDGSPLELFNSGASVEHEYSVANDYQCKFTPEDGTTFPLFKYNNSGQLEKIISFDQWGTYNLYAGSLRYFFYGCLNMVYNATDYPSSTNQSIWQFTFRDCVNADPDFTGWNFENGTGTNYINTMIFNSGISTANYDNLLQVLDSQTLPTPANLNANGATYTLEGAGETARNSLITKGWNISGDTGV